MWERYTPRTFRALFLPEELKKSMEDYAIKTGVRNTEIFDSAIFELIALWDDGKREEVKKALRFNPPPKSKKKIKLNVRFTGEKSFTWVCDLETKHAAVFSTEDFIKRALSWFLRKEGFLKI